MLIVTEDTVRNRGILKVRQLPRKFFGRVTVWPKGPVRILRFLRIIVEFQWIRYTLALVPFLGLGLTWNNLAMPLAQAPLIMLAMIWWVEMRILRVPKSRRAGLIDTASAERGLDLLQVQARAVLTQIAAGRGLRTGTLHLVIEQSDLGVFPPLTYVSVQSEAGPEILSLTAEEQEVIRHGLFMSPMTEQLLLKINKSQDTFLRDVTFEPRTVSAHARMTAALSRP